MPERPTPMVGMASGQYAVEIAVRNTLRKWLRTHVTAAARRNVLLDPDYMTTEELEELLTNRGRDGIPLAPRNDIKAVTSFDDWHTESLPQIQIISPSWAAAGGNENGLHFLYDVQVGCLVGASEHQHARFFRSIYEDAIPATLKQHQDLGGIATEIELINGGGALFDVLDEAHSRTLQGSTTAFRVLVLGVLDPYNGPATPDPLPDDENGVPIPWPTDPTVDEDGLLIDIIARPEDGPITP